ncbi:hypothetical protein JOM56_010321 [Amanita muscaria]
MLQHAFPDDPIVGEEDVSDLRTDSGAALRERIVNLANETLMGELELGDNKGWGIGPGRKRSASYLLDAMVDEQDPSEDTAARRRILSGCHFPRLFINRHFFSWVTLSGADPTPIQMPDMLSPTELNLLESVDGSHSSHLFNERVSTVIGVTHVPVRMD